MDGFDQVPAVAHLPARIPDHTPQHPDRKDAAQTKLPAKLRFRLRPELRHVHTVGNNLRGNPSAAQQFLVRMAPDNYPIADGEAQFFQKLGEPNSDQAASAAQPAQLVDCVAGVYNYGAG